MFTHIRTSALRLSIFAACIFTAGAASAHPEMDEFGRDITSRPVVDLMIDELAALYVAPGETTGSLTAADTALSVGLSSPCRRQTPEACPPVPQQDKPVRIRPDN